MLTELLAQQKRLDEQIAAARAEQRSAVIAEVKQLIADYGLTDADLSAPRGRQGPRNKAPVKFRSPQGQEWSGRGARPRWLAAALSDGASLESFRV